MTSIVLPDGTPIRGRGLRKDLETPHPDAGLYIGSTIKHRPEFTWQQTWVRWPDFMLPLDRHATAAAIVRHHDQARAGAVVEVACGGGVGRTGTVLSCMATMAGLSPEEAIAWVRANYHRRAVETPWQRRWVVWFATRRSRLGR
ncbi:protein-tyrosine phosphatase family protein [Nonomuraea sp. NPDC050556]|uniref:phosphatase domain-containing protein n=1 Tax=Nonomuraea sp. NPDC050556 TaxID=3364369 RepID=UPI0037B06E8D